MRGRRHASASPRRKLVALHYAMGKLPSLLYFGVIINGLAVWFELSGVLGAFLAVTSTAIMTIVFSEFPGARPTLVLSPERGRT